MQNAIRLLVLLLVSFTLVACGSSETSNKKEDSSKEKQEKAADENKSSAERQAEWMEQQEKEDDVDKTDARKAAEESGEWEEADFGKIKIVGVGYNDEVGIDGTDSPGKPVEMGPMKLYIESAGVLEIEPNEEAKDMFFEGRDKVRGIIIDMKAENTSDNDVEFHPNQAILVTDTGEQVESDMYLMGDVGGDFLGKVKKEDQTWWILNDPDKDIKSIKMIINPPSNSDDFEDLSEQKRLEFEVLSFEESKKRDEE
ncbi:hypothetical protein J22TS1_44270 [Siminovitchia terrae]|uniref:hypothetical protein n=1 Tax=Siminovitchia terrae TaxID=1914933 RepID=UPI001AFF0763|nr:hypothetical protein [Siminovitchia terrae]GIN93376.1 hypothetical protein J22TS1_44270 [Siminovitchia terrae]